VSKFADLIDLITHLVRRTVPAGAEIKEFPGLIDAAALKKIAMSAPRLLVLLGYGGQGEVRRLNEGEAVAALSFGVFVVAKGQGNVVAAGRTAAAVALDVAAALASFTPAVGLPLAGAHAARPGVLGALPPEEIVVETDSTKELLEQHILFHVVSWTHELIIGQPGDYPGDAYGALTEAQWDRPDGSVAGMDADTINDLGGE
jgi:hypothetical protein